eukprot:COSAG02_NODE_85663_length_100_cov_330.000000_1_plen_30_part_10
MEFLYENFSTRCAQTQKIIITLIKYLPYKY